MGTPAALNVSATTGRTLLAYGVAMCVRSNLAGVVPTKLGHRPSELQNHGRESIHTAPMLAASRRSVSAFDFHRAGIVPMQLDGLLLRLLMQSRIEASLGGGKNSPTLLVLPRNRSTIRCSESDHSATVMSRDEPWTRSSVYAFEM